MTFISHPDVPQRSRWHRSGDNYKTLITVLWSPKKDSTFNKSDAVKRMIDNDLQDMLPGAVEKEVSVQSFKGIDETGYYFLVTDKAPKPGEYPHAVRAGVGVGDLLLSVTVLCRRGRLIATKKEAIHERKDREVFAAGVGAGTCGVDGMA